MHLEKQACRATVKEAWKPKAFIEERLQIGKVEII